jgi:hypothetical protein
MTMKTIRAQVRGSLLHGIRTTDAARPMRDALLTIPTPEQWKAYNASVAEGCDMGMIWDGTEAALRALSDEKRQAFYDRLDAHRELEAGKRKRAVGSLDGGTTDFDPFGRHESAKLGRELNRRNREAWGQGHVPGRGVTR